MKHHETPLASFFSSQSFSLQVTTTDEQMSDVVFQPHNNYVGAVGKEHALPVVRQSTGSRAQKFELLQTKRLRRFKHLEERSKKQ